jgi:transcriptional regulator with XRE-family HTH domain
VTVTVAGANLRRALALRGMTGAEFAAAAQVTPATVSHALNGRPISIVTVRRLAVALCRVPVMPGALALLATDRASS